MKKFSIVLFSLLATLATTFVLSAQIQNCPVGYSLCINCGFTMGQYGAQEQMTCVGGNGPDPVETTCYRVSCSRDLSGGACMTNGHRGTWYCNVADPSYANACGNGYEAHCPGTPSEGCSCEQGSPIVIDLNDEGFHITTAKDGIVFDLKGTDGNQRAKQMKWSWTDQNYSNAFLVLDRNGNGTIDNGQELFGNHTVQPVPAAGSEKNGFAALAVFDTQAQGGNGNGFIDPGDTIYSRLQLWVDRNHDGISQSTELFTLASKGIARISLEYKETKLTDKYGNEFRYKGKIKNTANGQADRVIYDVFLVPGEVVQQ